MPASFISDESAIEALSLPPPDEEEEDDDEDEEEDEDDEPPPEEDDAASLPCPPEPVEFEELEHASDPTVVPIPTTTTT